MDKSDKSLVRLELIRKHIGIPLYMSMQHIYITDYQ